MAFTTHEGVRSGVRSRVSEARDGYYLATCPVGDRGGAARSLRPTPPLRVPSQRDPVCPSLAHPYPRASSSSSTCPSLFRLPDACPAPRDDLVFAGVPCLPRRAAPNRHVRKSPSISQPCRWAHAGLDKRRLYRRHVGCCFRNVIRGHAENVQEIARQMSVPLRQTDQGSARQTHTQLPRYAYLAVCIQLARLALDQRLRPV